MLGVCYYPEQCAPALWPSDVRRMMKLGLQVVRIGEFAWSRLEPKEGVWDFSWLDQILDLLHQQGLQVVLGTPTATPPKWLIDKHPEILAVDIYTGHKRGFGARRHYDFSSDIYLEKSLAITQQLAKRYGTHPAVIGWQTDNELCCHDTTCSASNAARTAFQQWCEQRYTSTQALNEAWGNVFWSMEYPDFSSIELPLFAVTETNPAHRLAYQRFSSDQVLRFHNAMVSCIRQFAPNHFVTHNFIPMQETDVDNYSLAAALDFASYDNYPLGRTDLFFRDAPLQQRRRWMRTGHPDFATFFHDQTRGLTSGKFWIMEQQPGPVNWAEHNPHPAPGMVRLWTLEAIAHGAERVCYFRWRQAAFAQEQMHAGLLRPDDCPSPAWTEIEQVQHEITQCALEALPSTTAEVAIITGASSQWIDKIERQGAGFDYTRIHFEVYSTLRQMGLNVDFVPIHTDFSKYKLVLAPMLPILDQDFIQRCQQSTATFLFGPRTGAKTQEFRTPHNLAPGLLQQLLPLKVVAVETLPEGVEEPVLWSQMPTPPNQSLHLWNEHLECSKELEILAHSPSSGPILVRHQRFYYLGCLPTPALQRTLFAQLCQDTGIQTFDAPENVRITTRGDLHFAFNYNDSPATLDIAEQAYFVLGSATLKAHDVCIWKAVQ
ncbi:MAG: beta-galactosidase [Myxococcota bacterium]